jgi:hypothetical protein
VGWDGLLEYKRSLLGVAAQGASNALAAKQRYGMFPTDMPNLHGLSYGLSHGAHWGQALNVVLCCVVLGFAARQKASLLVALPAAMLVSYHMQPHDLVLLLLPLTVLLDVLLQQRGVAVRLRGVDKLWLAAVCLLVLPLAAVLMMKSLNYVVSVAVVLVMVAVARRDSVAA